MVLAVFKTVVGSSRVEVGSIPSLSAIRWCDAGKQTKPRKDDEAGVLRPLSDFTDVEQKEFIIWHFVMLECRSLANGAREHDPYDDAQDFADAIRNVRIPGDIGRIPCGWTVGQKAPSFEAYGDGYGPWRLKDEIDNVSFPGVDHGPQDH